MDSVLTTIRIAGVGVSDLSAEALLDNMFETGPGSRPCASCYINPHAVNLAASDPDFLEKLNAFDFAPCDGHGVFWAARVLGTPLKHCWTWPQHGDALFSRCVLEKKRVYLIGETPERIEQIAAVLRERHPDLHLAGFRNGFFSGGDTEIEQALSEWSAADPDVTILGMAMPGQEKLALRLRSRSTHGAILCTGAFLAYYGGCLTRCPDWMYRLGLEWLYRLVRNPGKLFHRYVVGNIRFCVRVFRERGCRRRTGRNTTTG